MTYIRELNNGELSKVGETVMGSILIDNEGDILHRLRTEPAGHGYKLVISLGGGHTDSNSSNVFECWFMMENAKKNSRSSKGSNLVCGWGNKQPTILST